MATLTASYGSPNPSQSSLSGSYAYVQVTGGTPAKGAESEAETLQLEMPVVAIGGGVHYDLALMVPGMMYLAGHFIVLKDASGTIDIYELTESS